ncbi:MAG: EF-hand domain-containing protein [Candidatus Thiodiazotropha endolucinida]
MMRLNRSIVMSVLLIVPGFPLAQSQLTVTGPIPFSVFDRDGNGFISQQEFATTHAERRALRAQRGYPMGRTANPVFQNFDSNDDGRINEKELLAGQHANRLMKGSSGMDGKGMRGRDMPMFGDFDMNGDGVLKQDEFEQARAKRISERASQGYLMRNLANAPTFASIDRDSNGEVTPDEFRAAQIAHRLQRIR